MTRQLLLEMFNKGLILDLILIIFAFGILWITILKLGFGILKVTVKLTGIIPGVLFGVFISFIKPFLPGIFFFFIVMLPTILLLKIYGKTKWIIACWVTFLLLLFSNVGPMFIIGPLVNSNQAIASFIFETTYGVMLGTLSEALFPAILLMILKVFNVSMIPSPGKAINAVDFFDIYLFGALLFWCYDSFMTIWEVVKKSPKQLLFRPIAVWIVAAGTILAFYIKKVNTQKKLEQTLEMYQNLKESKVDPQELNDFSDKLLKTLNRNTNIDFPPYIINLPEIKFTRREQDVIRLIEQGYNNDEIARNLSIVPGRVANIISDLISKTGLSDRKLTVYAMYWVKQNKNNP
jgi:DNA-binding CsgD family transcriptional regulator